MDANKKEIIVTELHFWKENRLLPEKYCDFLLMLYSQGDYKENSSKKKFGDWKNIMLMLQGLFVFLPITFIHFTKLNFVMQIVSLVIFLLIHIGLVFFQKKKSELAFQAALFFSIFYFLLSNLYIVTSYEMQISLLIAVLFVHVALWLCIGLIAKIRYYIVCSCIAISIIAITFFIKYIM